MPKTINICVIGLSCSSLFVIFTLESEQEFEICPLPTFKLNISGLERGDAGLRDYCIAKMTIAVTNGSIAKVSNETALNVSQNVQETFFTSLNLLTRDFVIRARCLRICKTELYF